MRQESRTYGNGGRSGAASRKSLNRDFPVYVYRKAKRVF